VTERKQLVINGKRWTLAWKNRLPRAYGRTVYDKLRIELERGLPEDRTLATLIHEVLHVLSDDYRLALDHDTINRLEAGLFDFLATQGIDLAPLIYALKGEVKP